MAYFCPATSRRDAKATLFVALNIRALPLSIERVPGLAHNEMFGDGFPLFKYLIFLDKRRGRLHCPGIPLARHVFLQSRPCGQFPVGVCIVADTSR
jgi:hypothetical protein